MSVKLVVKILEDEVYSLRQQYQCLKDLVYCLASKKYGDVSTTSAIQNWFEEEFPIVFEQTEKVESVSDIKTFLKNVIKDN